MPLPITAGRPFEQVIVPHEEGSSTFLFPRDHHAVGQAVELRLEDAFRSVRADALGVQLLIHRRRGEWTWVQIGQIRRGPCVAELMEPAAPAFEARSMARRE